jgi:hypothetical protein
MRYGDQDQESRNVEDRRGQDGGGMFGGGGGGLPFPIQIGGGRGGFSLTTMLIIGALMLLFGFNPLDMLTGGGGQIPQMPQQRPFDPGQGRTASQQGPWNIPSGPARNLPQGGVAAPDEMSRFVARVLKDTEDVWNNVFQQFGRRYEEPKLVMFTGATRTACGVGQTAMGPFYCPLDRKIYIDLAFYEELKRRFRAPGDFAQAYVVAHEVGHHVQTILGIAEKVQSMKQRMSERDANALQVRMELQADCLAGMWARMTDEIKGRLEQGDIEEGLNAAAAIGDDMIQRQTTGRIVPEAFTHGSSQQRVRWFKLGYDRAQMQVCDTFNAQNL